MAAIPDGNHGLFRESADAVNNYVPGSQRRVIRRRSNSLHNPLFSLTWRDLHAI